MTYPNKPRWLQLFDMVHGACADAHMRYGYRVKPNGEPVIPVFNRRYDEVLSGEAGTMIRNYVRQQREALIAEYQANDIDMGSFVLCCELLKMVDAVIEEYQRKVTE